MVTAKTRKPRRRWIVLACVPAVIGLFLWLLPVGLRLGAERILAGQGVTAEIEDIDLNLFTGKLIITNARGEGEQGTGFDVAHLLANLDYGPLFSKQLHLSNLELHDSQIGVKVDAAGDMQVAGFTVPADAQEQPEEEDATPWGIGVERAEIGALRLRYQQPGFDREITLSSATSSVDTANADNAFPIDMQVSLEDSRIKVTGQVKPFGERITSDLKLNIEDFDLGLVAPLAEQAEIARLAGIVNSGLDVDLDYHADEGLSLGADGGLAVAGAEVVMPALQLDHANLDWDGQIQVQLLQAAADADRVSLDGTLKLDKIDATLPETLALEQESIRWQGKIATRLGPPLAINADGALRTAGTEVSMPELLKLSQGSVDWRGKIQTTLADAGPKLDADGKLETTDTDLTLNADGTVVEQSALDWQGQVHMTPGEAGPSLDSRSSLTAKGTAVTLPASGLDLGQQRLTWDGSADFAPGDPAVVHADGDLMAEGLELALAEQNMIVTGQRIGFSGQAGLDPDAQGIPPDTQLPLTVEASVEASGIAATDTTVGRRLAGLNELAVQTINISGLGDIGIARIAADGITALARADKAPRIDTHPNVLQIGNLTIEDTAVSEQARVNIGSVTIAGIDGLLYRPADGSWELEQWFESGAQAGEDGSDALGERDEDAGEQAELELALSAFYIRGSSLAVEDRGVTPTFTSQLSKLNMTMADLNTLEPARGSSLNLQTAVGRFGNLKAQGTVKPFLEPPSAELTGTIEAIDLGSASGYVNRAIDRRIDRGTVSADLDFDLTRGDIDAEAELKFSKLRIGGAQNAAGAVKDKLGLPLDKILSLLRNGDGNILLELPVGGDLENPTFSIFSIVRKAIFKGLQAAVLSVYSPLGIVKLGKGLVNLATATGFEPLLFRPGDSQLNDSDRQQLDKTVEILNNRPEADVIICGHAVPADRKALGLPPAADADADGDRPDADGTEGSAGDNPQADASEQLLQLAGTRGDAVGDYLVAQGLAGKRFVLCNPSLGEPGDAEPRAEISF